MAVTQPSLAGLDMGGVAKRSKGGDHRRRVTRRTLAPATVRVGDGWIEVVVPDVLGKNEAMRRAGKVMHTSAATKRYREAVQRGAAAWRSTRPLETLRLLQAMQGAWRLEVLSVWPTGRHTIAGRACDVAACPMGDMDAPVSQALDALMHAGILDDDARVVLGGPIANLYRKGERWTVIRLVRVPDLAERDTAIAHLVAALPPPVVSADATVAIKRRKR